MSAQHTSIAIIGAGISGLSLAYELQKKNIPYMLFESSDRVGGYIQTQTMDGCILEEGPNSLLCDQTMNAFLEELGLTEDIIEASTVANDRFIIKNGKLAKVPAHPAKLLFGNFLSWKTKWKIIRELFSKPQSPSENETLSAFFTRHFGQEVTDYLVRPFVGGIYAGNPDELLTSLSFPKLLEMEAQYGSILKGFAKNKSLERRRTIYLKNGLHSLPQRMADKLEHLQLNCPIQKITKEENGYALETAEGTFHCEKVVLATPASTTAKLLPEALESLSRTLESIPNPPMVIVHNLYKASAETEALQGFGALFPPIEKRFASGTIWASSVFSGKCPDDKFLLTSFVGGRANEEKALLSEAEISERVSKENSELLGLPAPEKQILFTYKQTIPQYTKEAKLAQENLKTLEKEGIFICSNWKGGISVPDCIAKGRALANSFL